LLPSYISFIAFLYNPYDKSLEMNFKRLGLLINSFIKLSITNIVLSDKNLILSPVNKSFL